MDGAEAGNWWLPRGIIFNLTAAESKATYEEIKQYVLDKYGLKVSNLNIAQIKTKCVIIERENYNKSKKENAIKDALKHFQMI